MNSVSGIKSVNMEEHDLEKCVIFCIFRQTFSFHESDWPRKHPPQPICKGN